MYLDANNLYGWAMSQPLPTHDFRWVEQNDIQQFKVMNIPDDNAIGYIIECDLGTFISHIKFNVYLYLL